MQKSITFLLLWISCFRGCRTRIRRERFSDVSTRRLAVLSAADAAKGHTQWTDSGAQSQEGERFVRALACFLVARRNRSAIDRLLPARRGRTMLRDTVASGASEVAALISSGVVGRLDRLARQHRMQDANLEVLLVALLAARLSSAAYAKTHAELADKLDSQVWDDVPGGFKVLHFQGQSSDKNERSEIHPQWFLARGALPRWSARDVDASSVNESDAGEALFLVFRGTGSTTDIIRDACISAEDQHGGCFHSGFLKGVRDDSELHSQLHQAIGQGCKHLYVFGHSLGGSLAMTLVSANLLPTTYSGLVTVVGLGAPPSIVSSSIRNCTSDLRSPPSSSARFVLVVNDCDVVPRLLGSQMPVSTASMLASSVPSPTARALMRRNVKLMETMEQYSHPKNTEIVLLKDGIAKAVPSSEHAAVLHLHEALSPRLLDAHYTSSYIHELEIAAIMAEFGKGSRGNV